MHTTTQEIQIEPSRLTQPNKVGLVFAALIGGWHILWVLLVLTKIAQPFFNFIFWAHMIAPIYVIKPFDPVAAITLLVVTSVSGYVFGYIGSIIWNKIHRA